MSVMRRPTETYVVTCPVCRVSPIAVTLAPYDGPGLPLELIDADGVGAPYCECYESDLIDADEYDRALLGAAVSERPRALRHPVQPQADEGVEGGVMSDTVKWADLSPRERDALVAKRVMGWKLVMMGTTGVAGGVEPGGDYSGRVPVPSYTTDIAAAWEVVEKMREQGFCVTVDWTGDGLWSVELWRWHDSGYPDDVSLSSADTAPEAIAIAALRAVGVEVET